MEITLAKALVVKKELVSKLQELHRRFKNNFSVKENNQRDYDPKEILNEITNTTQNLIEVKCKIQQANVPIEHKILELGELKLFCKLLQDIRVQSSVKEAGFVDGKSVYIDVMMDNFYTVPQKDQKISEIRKEIIARQSELNEYNYSTKIQLSFEM